MFRKTKSKLAVLLSLALYVSMMAGTSVFAAGAYSSDGTSYTSIGGEEYFVKDTGEISLEPELVGDESEDSGISGYNYHTSWQKVSAVNSRPYNGVVKITTTYTNGAVMSGTGFVAADGKILTAAHIIYDRLDSKKGWARNLKIEFRKNGSVYKVLNTLDASIPTAWMTASDLTNDPYIYDYGLIRVPTSYTDEATKFGLYAGVYASQQYTISGYPNTNPYTGNYMYTDNGYIESDEGYRVKHDIDIMNGVSGGPMYGSNIYAVGIQTRGWSHVVRPGDATDSEYGTGGWVTPITSEIISFVANN